MTLAARGFALFMNWFNGILATLCGATLALDPAGILPFSWNDWMPIEILAPFPLHDVFFASWLWPGLALLLVNGVPNVVALVQRFRGNLAASYKCGMVAGVLLLAWTIVEMVFIPNGLSVFYLILGVLQLPASWISLRSLGEK